MKIERMDYVDTKRFTLEELLILERLLQEQGYLIGEEVNEYRHEIYLHYGVDGRGDALFYDFFFINNGGNNITEQFREYLKSLASTEEHPLEKHETQEITPESLTVKERLLSLADGKELEWYDYSDESDFQWHLLESFQSDFGDILYDESTKVRVKPDDPIKCAYDKLALHEDMTTFDIFKAGYEAAKNND